MFHGKRRDYILKDDLVNYRLLDIKDTNVASKCKVSWSRKQKKAYMNALSGLRKYRTLGLDVSFLTLTTSPEAVCLGHNLNRDFNELARRITRGGSWCDWWERYAELENHCELCNFFAKCNKKSIKLWLPFQFEYFKVKTSEGLGVLHILGTLPYIPVKFLSRLWNVIHFSPNIWINLCYNYSGKIASYMVGKYLSAQAHFERMSMSLNWVFRGFRGFYKKLFKKYGYSLSLGMWRSFLCDRNFFEKIKLRNFDLDLFSLNTS